MIPYARQEISEADIKAVVKVLKSDFITQGPVTPEFEKKVSKYCKSRFACAVNSGTSALHIACLSLGVEKGDKVWTSPISFVASSNCALYCGAKIDFVDIDPLSYNMSVDALEEKLIKAKKMNTLPKVLIPVHLSGQSCEMDRINKLSKIYGFKIIEDASHAIGAKYKGELIGNCRYSDITIFSFHPVKIITTCEGGICTTNNPKISTLLGRYRSHGITRHSQEMKNVPDGPWYYEQLELGFNYRLNDVMASLGISQLKRVDEFVNKRNAIAEKYDSLFKELDIKVQEISIDNYSSRHLYIIRVKGNSNYDQKSVFEKFRASGIWVNLHYIPIYRQPYYKNMNFNKKDFPEAEKYYKEAISIPIFPSLKDKEIEKIVNVIKKPIGFQNLF